MKAPGLMFLGFVSWLACACAEAYDPSPAGTLGSAVLTAPTSGVGGSGGAAAEQGMGGVGGGGGGIGGVAAPLDEPCTQGDVMPCPCEGTSAQGQRTCLFDMASPTQGVFSDCQGCAPPDMPDSGGSTSGAGGISGAGGMSGSEAGSAGQPLADAGTMEEPTGPVDDCDGVPEGTECDRDCILPSNTARCNEQGNCSCL